MKKLLSIIFILAVSAGATTTYFGQQTGVSGVDAGNGGYHFGSSISRFTCPGTGSKDVVSLGAQLYSAGVGTGYFRMAIYSVDLQTLYAQHSAQISVPAIWTTSDWRGESQGITQYATLTGGVTYTIVITLSSNDIDVQDSTGVLGNAHYGSGDYSATGFSAPITMASAYNLVYLMRCGVVDHVLHQFNLTMAVTNAASTTPAVGVTSEDSGAAVAINTVGGQGYRFQKWTRTASTPASTFGDSSLASTTITVKGAVTVTAVDTIIHYQFTNANDGHGTFTPVSALKDTAASFAIAGTAAVGYRFWKWTRSGVNVVITDSSAASTNAYLKAAGTITLNDSIIHYTLTMAGNSTTPTVGAHLEDTAAATSINETPASGYAFKSWHISGAAAHITDTTVKSNSVWLSGNATVTANDTLMPVISLDSMRTNAMKDSGKWKDTLSFYGSYFGASQGSSTISIEDSTPTVVSWTNTLIKIKIPNLDTGWIDTTIVSDGVTADTLINGFKILPTSTVPTYTVTIVNAAHAATISPTAGAHSIDSGAVTNLTFSGPAGYRKSGIAASNSAYVVFNSDSSTFYPKHDVTLTWSDTIIHFTLTMAGTHGTTTPSIGAHLVDTNVATAIDNTPNTGYRFQTWSGAGVTFGSATTKSTTAAIGSNATATATDTIIHFTVTMVNATHAGTISPTAGDHLEDTAASTVLTFVGPAGYRLSGWTSTGGVHFDADSTHFYLTSDGAITAHDTIIHYLMTNSATHGSFTPATGLQDSGAVFAIAATAAAHYFFTNWTVSGGAHVAVADVTATTAYLTGPGTITANFQAFGVYDFIDLGDSNLVMGGANNFVKFMIDTKYGVGAKTHLNSSVAGQTSTWAAAKIDTIFQTTTATIAVVLAMGTNDVLYSTDNATLISVWKANAAHVLASCQAAGCALWVMLPPPSVYDAGYPNYHTQIKLLCAAAVEWCNANNVICQNPELQLISRPSTEANADEFSLNDTWRGSSDKYHYSTVNGPTRAGGLLARTTIPPVKSQYFGDNSFDTCGHNGWSTCWLTGTAAITGDADKGTLTLVANDTCKLPVMAIDDYATHRDNVKKVQCALTTLTGTCDIYMRSWPQNMTPANRTSAWIKTATLYTMDHFVEAKIVGTSVATIDNAQLTWSLQ